MMSFLRAISNDDDDDDNNNNIPPLGVARSDVT